MLEKAIRELEVEYVMQYIGIQTNNKYMKNYCKNMYLDASNLRGQAMSQKLFVNGFKQKENVSKFDEDYIKNYDKGSGKGHVDIESPKNLGFYNLHNEN